MSYSGGMTDYATIKVPESFRDRFEELNKQFDLGYASLAEFTKEAMRQRFEEIIRTYQDSTE